MLGPSELEAGRMSRLNEGFDLGHGSTTHL